MRFTRDGVLVGARATLPLAVSTAAFGVVFGALARQAGLSLAEAGLMSGLVFAGAAQFIVLELCGSPLPVATLILTTLVVNARHLLMGAALRPWFARVPARRAYASVFFLADESWAFTLREFAVGRRDGAILIGSGLTLSVCWIGGTIVGQAAGSKVDDPARWGLDFAFTALFAALLVGTRTDRQAALPWAVAAGVAVVAHRWLPGTWYILSGGLASGLAGAVRDGG